MLQGVDIKGEQPFQEDKYVKKASFIPSTKQRSFAQITRRDGLHVKDKPEEFRMNKCMRTVW